MCGEPKVVDVDVFGVDTGVDHEYANYALQGAKNKEDNEGSNHGPVEVLFEEEPDEAYGEYYAEHARPDAVEPFPEEDGFEVGELVIGIDEFILSYLFVAVECVFPLFVVKWW